MWEYIKALFDGELGEDDDVDNSRKDAGQPHTQLVKAGSSRYYRYKKELFKYSSRTGNLSIGL